MATITKREEYRQYIRSVWSPNNTYKDVENLAATMGVSLEYLKGLLKDMNLTYLTKRDMACLSREKYLREVWCKQPRKSRFSLDELAKKLQISVSTLNNDIKRLGLEKYVLTQSELSSRNNQNKSMKEREENVSKLSKVFEEYKKTGKQYLYEELALKLNLSLRFVKLEVKSKGYTSMIKPYKETCSKSQRMSYYKFNRDVLRKNLSLLRLSIKFGIPTSQVQVELVEAGVVRSFSVLDSDLNNIDTANSDYNKPSFMSYEELNRTLGVPYGTYYSDESDELEKF